MRFSMGLSPVSFFLKLMISFLESFLQIAIRIQIFLLLCGWVQYHSPTVGVGKLFTFLGEEQLFPKGINHLRNVKKATKKLAQANKRSENWETGIGYITPSAGSNISK